MIIKIPQRFIEQSKDYAIIEYFINPEKIMWVDVTKFIYENVNVENNCTVSIVMDGGAFPKLKTMSEYELQDFILWWNKSLNIEKLKESHFLDTTKKGEL